MSKRVQTYKGSKQEQIDKETEAALGDSEICTRCKATFATFGELCTAGLAEECEGFRKIDETRQPIVNRIYKF